VLDYFLKFYVKVVACSAFDVIIVFVNATVRSGTNFHFINLDIKYLYLSNNDIWDTYVFGSATAHIPMVPFSLSQYSLGIF
jgi:hypothetical protein